MSTEFFIVDSHSFLGELVDCSALLAVTAQEALTFASISSHELGLFLTEGVGNGAPAIGYVACTEILAGEDIAGIAAPPGKEFAVLGGLSVKLGYPHRSLGRLLAASINERVLDTWPDLAGCVADCNSKTAPAFVASGYEPVFALPKKVRYVLRTGR